MSRWKVTGHRLTNFDRIIGEALDIDIKHLAHVVVLVPPAQPISFSGRDARALCRHFAETNMISPELYAELEEITPEEDAPNMPAVRPNPDLVRLSEFMLDEYPELMARHGVASREGKGVTDIVIQLLTRPPEQKYLTAQEVARSLEMCAQTFDEVANAAAKMSNPAEERVYTAAGVYLKTYAATIRAVFSDPAAVRTPPLPAAPTPTITPQE